MKYLVIRFISDKSIISTLIDWQSDSLWCHCEAIGRDGTQWIGAHAGSGVAARALDWAHPTHERQYSLEVEDSAYDAAMTWLEGKIGCPYDYKDIVGLALHKRIGASDHQIICSALMVLFLMRAGIAPLNCLEGYTYLITPETLHLSPVFIGRCTYHQMGLE